MSVDVSGITELVVDLRGASSGLLAKVQPVVAKGAVNVKRDMRKDMAASQHFGQVARVISYDITATKGAVEAQVGPETGGEVVGDLAHLAYFGGINSGGGTVRDPQSVLDEEAPRLVSAMEALVQGIL